jgi:GNAT superfamily N-acetyltransferase
MPSASAGARQPLDREACHVLAKALGDTPETVISLHVLRQGTCKAYVAGHPARFDGAIIQSDDLPTEPVGFGSDPHVLWELLQGVEGWDCILVDNKCAPVLGEMMEQELGVRVRYLEDVCHILTQPVVPFRSPAVRQLTLADLELLASASPKLRASCWDSLDSLLSQGIVACALVSGQIVATALTAARSQRHADVGVYTHPNHRQRGFAKAAASMVAQRVHEAGQVPVWGAGEHNTPSLRIAAKLGFVEVSRRTYVIKTHEA